MLTVELCVTNRPSRGTVRQPAPSRRRTTRRLVVLGIVGLALIAIAAITLSRRPPSPPSGVQSYEVASAQHVEGPVAYPQNPPVGGDHAPQWQNCGFYSSPIPKETAVHSMEHGAVWITYRPDLTPDQVNRIRQITAAQSYVLASPYPDLPTPIVVSAWGRQLTLDSAEDPRLEQFIGAFKQGPTTPERGAPCGGGVGTPR
jgi:hypothetical protein